MTDQPDNTVAEPEVAIDEAEASREEPSPGKPPPVGSAKDPRTAKEARGREWYVGPNATNRGPARNAGDLEVDQRWVDLLETFLGGAEKLEVLYQRGPKYQRAFIDNVVTLVGENARESASRLASDIWAECVKYTTKNGPSINWQLKLFGREGKRGKLLELGCVAVRINLAGPLEDLLEDDPNDVNQQRMLVAHASGMLREARLDREDHRLERQSLITAYTSMVKGTGEAMESCIHLIGRGIHLIEAGAAYNQDLLNQTLEREERRFAAEYNLEKVRVIGEGIKTAAEVVSGEGAAAFAQWMATKNPETAMKPFTTLVDGSQRLLDSLTMAISRVMPDESFSDLCSALEKAAEAKDELFALPPLKVAFEIIKPVVAEVEPLLSPAQKMIVAFLRGRISAYESGKFKG